ERQHDEAGHDIGAIGDAIDFGNARPDGPAKDHEIERSRDYGRDHALQERAKGASHLEFVDGADCIDIHDRSFTRLTKISSSELCWVLRSRNRMPASPRSCTSAVMRVRAPCVS